MPFEIRTESQECPDFDLAEFCQALALACGAAVQPAVDWRYMDEREIFNTNHAMSRILPYVQLSVHPLWLAQPIPVVVPNSRIHEAKALYIARSNLGAKTKAELSVPIDRWVKSKANRNDVSSGPHHQDSGEAKIRESTAGVSRKPSSDGKACGCSSKHLCGLTAWNT